jgi:hypothetical protein
MGRVAYQRTIWNGKDVRWWFFYARGDPLPETVT